MKKFLLFLFILFFVVGLMLNCAKVEPIQRNIKVTTQEILNTKDTTIIQYIGSRWEAIKTISESVNSTTVFLIKLDIYKYTKTGITFEEPTSEYKWVNLNKIEGED